MAEIVLTHPSPTTGHERRAGKERSGPRRRLPRIVWFAATVLGLVLLLGALAGVKASQVAMLVESGEQVAEAGPPFETVSTAHAKVETWEETLNVIGSVVSDKGVAVSNDAPGAVSQFSVDANEASLLQHPGRK